MAVEASWEWIPVLRVLSVQLTMDAHKTIVKRMEKSDLNNECVIYISPVKRF